MLDFVNDYSATAAAGMAAYGNTLTVDNPPPGGDVSGVRIPVTLTSGATVINTVLTDVSGNDLTVLYAAPSGGLAGPVSVICAPNAQTMRTLRSIERAVFTDPYTTSHSPLAGVFNDHVASTYNGTAHDVHLPDPQAVPGFDANGQDIETATRTTLLLRGGGITYTFWAPSGMTLHWEAGAPAESSGKPNVLVDLVYTGTDVFGSFRVFA